jgi:hypothetical protein
MQQVKRNSQVSTLKYKRELEELRAERDMFKDQLIDKCARLEQLKIKNSMLEGACNSMA